MTTHSHKTTAKNCGKSTALGNELNVERKDAQWGNVKLLLEQQRWEQHQLDTDSLPTAV